MASAMIHRGPDDDGFHVDDRVGLGFRRLSIIDVAGGRQPLVNEDGTIHVVFNGEIYNHVELRRRLEHKGHRFRTNTDGEVLLHLFEDEGPALVEALNGIFAFALWNSTTGELLLARDHYGVKPLYYAAVDGRLLFASELKSILASGLISREMDPEAVAQYLVYQAVPPPLSILRDVRQLSPGSLLHYDGHDYRTRSYWTPPREADATIDSVEEACELVRTGLEGAVRRQMMSERPLGVFLSGGVDSSALVAIASQQVSHPIKTFSVGFVGPDETVLSEWPWARIVAERYATEHHEIVLTEAMFRDAMPHTFAAMDQPTADGINSYWVSHAAAQHVTVALSGTGADELFLGYPRDAHLLAHYRASRELTALPAGYVRALATRLAGVPNDLLWAPIARLKDAASTFAFLDAEFMSSRGVAMFEPGERDGVLSDALRLQAATFRAPAAFLADVRPDLARPADWLARLEQRAYLSYVLLRDIDAMSMSHSLEVRVPFLDPTYGEAVARIPSEMKLRDGVGKWVLKQALRPLLPDEILFRPKMGFGLPYNIWMRRSMAPMVRDLLSPARVARRGVFDVDATQDLLRRFYAGDDGVGRKVWTLLALEGWASEVLDAGLEVRNVRAA
jgi:asparagine synthase (glutamine-hydrolysing)